MKADHTLLIKLAELGILRSMPDFLAEPLKPGRLRARFIEIEFIVDNELKKMFAADSNIYTDNLEEITAYLDKFGRIMNTENLEKTDIHVASVVCFCLCFLEETKTIYPAKLHECLNDIVDYYERIDNVRYGDFMQGRKFHDEWEKISNV